MKLAVLSGKGGAGKTTISSSLAFVSKVFTIDADIEEPNLHLFLKGNNYIKKIVSTRYPEIDVKKCILCGKCSMFCKFNAIIQGKNQVIVFAESCHDCGGCEIICKQKAIKWKIRDIGNIIERDTYFNSKMKYGKLNIGEMSGVKIIKEMYQDTQIKDFIIDCPPGTSCTTVAAVEEADFAIIVTEASPFGLSDMKLVVKLLKELKILFGVVINKVDEDEDKKEIEKFCSENKIEVLEIFPFDREIAVNYSKGNIIAEMLPKYRGHFENILKKVIAYGY